MTIFDVIALMVFIGLPALELYAWFTASWWHDEDPRDPRNGL